MLYNSKYSFWAVSQYNDYSYIYIEDGKYSCTLYLVERLNGFYFGWRDDEPEGWYNSKFIPLPNEGDFIQAFLAPSILGRW